MSMPKEAFGGDDDGHGGAPEKKKMGLSKFGLSPDANIRDVFWRIMGSYAATRKADAGLESLGQDRFALMRAALSVLSNPNSEQYGLAPRFIAMYSLMMMVDGDWKDVLAEFLEKAAERKLGIRDMVAQAMRKLMSQERYGKALSEQLAAMVRSRGSVGVALEYVAVLDSRPLVFALKKELMIIARGDIGPNQLNAIKAVSLIKEDPDIRKSLVVLLSHWDSQARFAAAEVLASIGDDDEVRTAAERRLPAETDEDVRGILARIAAGRRKGGAGEKEEGSG
jgi:hypothetical protein